jgi:PAS domain S-box-containing protein/putative nucleotidyltransferase with HDIG domain
MAASLGMPASEIVGRLAFDLFPPAIAEARRAQFVQVLETGKTATYEDDRAGKTFINTIVPIRGEDGTVAEVALFALDVTERARAEQAVRRREVEIRGVVESTADGILVVDNHGRVLIKNSRFGAMWCIPKDLLAGGDDEALLAFVLDQLEDPEAFLKKVRMLYASDAEDMDELRFRDSRVFERYSRPLVLQGAVTGRVWSFRDVTQHRKASRALQESEELHRKIVAAIPDLVVRTALDGTILFVNEVATRLGDRVGTPDLIGQNIFSFVAPEDLDRAVEAMGQLLVKNPGPKEFAMRFGGGETIQFEVNGEVLGNAKGEPFGIILVCRDITERKQAEDRILHGYRELRETLRGAITSLSSAIEMRDPYTSGHQERVTRIACAVAREMGLDDETVVGIEIAGTVHDIGKLSIPAEILSKPSRLSDVEYALIKMHPQIGYTILSKIKFPWPIAKIVHQHHERIDGSGYPQGLRDGDILIEAKILAVADVVEAMSSHRPYRPTIGLPAALEEISRNKGVLYDPAVVEALLKLQKEGRIAFD